MTSDMLMRRQATYDPQLYYARGAMPQKLRSQSAFPSQSHRSIYRPGTGIYDDTEFEDDCSDEEEEEEYQGRRSEDSVSYCRMD